MSVLGGGGLFCILDKYNLFVCEVARFAIFFTEGVLPSLPFGRSQIESRASTTRFSFPNRITPAFFEDRLVILWQRAMGVD